MKLSLINLLLIGCCCHCVNAQQETQQAEAETTTISIASQDGKVSWTAIADAITEQVGVDVPALNRMAAGQIDLDSPGTRWTLHGINMVLRPAIRVSVNQDTKTVEVRIDENEIEKFRRKVGSKFRDSASAFDRLRDDSYKIQPYDPLVDLGNTKRIAIIVHGFNSSDERLTKLAGIINEQVPMRSGRTSLSGKRAQATFESPGDLSGNRLFGTAVDEVAVSDGGMTAASFSYTTRDGIELAATEFARQLQSLVEKNPDCEITLITHSMGGLISRAMIEDESFDIDQVKQIIMVAPPNNGTKLAMLPVGSDAFESFLVRVDRTIVRDAIRTVVGESNLAIEQLRPGSDFLSELESRPRNPNIEYTIILGRQALLTTNQGDVLRSVARQMENSGHDAVARSGQEIAKVISELADEFVSPNGDGVVSVESGKLDGVDDIVVLEFRHNDISTDGSEQQDAIIDEILKRLNRVVDR